QDDPIRFRDLKFVCAHPLPFLAIDYPFQLDLFGIKFKDYWFDQGLSSIVKVVRINPRAVSTHQPTTFGTHSHLRHGSANARAQVVLSHIRLRHDPFLYEPRAGGYDDRERDSRQHQTIDTLSAGP